MVIFRRQNIFPALLVLISAFLCWHSFVPNTWLSGWDTLHPEFNFGLSFERLVFGVFRSEQGLGAVAAHAHMADLPRVILMFLASVVFLASVLRYLFFSLCLITGVVGVYVFSREILLKTDSGQAMSADRQARMTGRGASAFLGGLFYLLNLGTLQHFYVPFEMFAVQYATLPWLFYLASSYLKQSKHITLLLFVLVTFVSAPMAFASTLWFAYFLALVLYLAVFFRKNLKKVILLLSLTLAINSFWILPNLYFVFSGAAESVPEAKINKIFSQEAFSYNQNYGTVLDSVVFRNFLLDWSAFDGQQGFDYLFQGWLNHLNNPWVIGTGYFLAGIALVGLVAGIWQKNRFALALILPALMALVFLINQNPPFDWLFALFREKVPLFSEALRFPFTKFSIILMFCLSCFFALGQEIITQAYQTHKINLTKILIVVQLVIFSSLLVFYMWPAFGGDLISKKVQVKIPQEYFAMFDWFNSQPEEGRIANFPLHSFWGWIYYSWGFQGAQFISFGIKQPLLDRDYDRWNSNNEEYYREMSFAVYSQNVDLIQKVLHKYKIHYILLDENVAAPGGYQGEDALFYNQIESLLLKPESGVKLSKQFGKILIYEVVDDYPVAVSAPVKYIFVSGLEGPHDLDFAYLNLGNYVDFQPGLKNTQGVLPVFYPFRSLIDNQNILNSSKIMMEGNKIKSTIDNIPLDQIAAVDQYFASEVLLPASLSVTQKTGGFDLKLDFGAGQLVRQLLIPASKEVPGSSLVVSLDNDQMVKGLKGSVMLGTKFQNTLAFYDIQEQKLTDAALPEAQEIQLCSPAEGNQFISLEKLDTSSFKMSAKNVTACTYIPLKTLMGNKKLTGFKDLVQVKFLVNSTTNARGHFCLFNKSLNRCVREQKEIKNFSLVEDSLSIDPANLDNYQLVFYLDKTGSGRLEEISYEHLLFSVTEPVASLTIYPEEIKTVLGQSTENLATGILSNYGGGQDLGEVNIFERGHESSFCSSIAPEKFSRVVDPGLGFVEYSSQKGSSCDYFSLPNLPHNVGYLLTIESRNVAGLPLRVCVANPATKKCDLYMSLPANKDFTSQTLLIPPINDGAVGLDIHLDNYSTGRIISTNRIKKVSIFTFPYNWFAQMSFPVAAKNLEVQNNLSVLSTEQISPWLYKVKVQGRGTGLITLNRSYDPGWIIFGQEHVKVNGWQNGWLIDPHQSGELWIIFWPELLELGGLAILLTVLIRYGIISRLVS